MKKHLLLIFLIIAGCSHINGEYHIYSFRKNAQIQIQSDIDTYMQWGHIVNGEYLVFEYEYVAEEDSRAEDDEYSEYIRFQIDPDIQEFHYQDSALLEQKMVFSKSCFCDFEYDSNKAVMPTGNISGEKLSETEWDVTIDVTFYGDDHRLVTGVFKLSE